MEGSPGEMGVWTKGKKKRGETTAIRWVMRAVNTRKKKEHRYMPMEEGGRRSLGEGAKLWARAGGDKR